jgi:hypothetical protein
MLAIAQDTPLAVSLTPSIPSPAPVGAVIVWSAFVSSVSTGLVYRFRTRRLGEDFRVRRDYAPANTFTWTVSDHEGWFEIESTARDRGTGETASTTARYKVTSLVDDTSPLLSPTSNPLVFLYSAAPCPVESRMRVQFQSADGVVQYTPYQPCVHGLSMNFYIAGLRVNTSYSVKHTVDSGFDFTDGPVLTLHTSNVNLALPRPDLIRAPAPGTTGTLLHSNLFGPSFATDLSGNVVWFYPGQYTLLTRAEAGGRFLALVANAPIAGFGDTLREFDLAGNILRETNVATVNEQLFGLGKAAIGVFHHDAIRMPDGRIAVLATTEQLLMDVQGRGAVDVLGDMIVVLDQDLQVVWTWNAFDHLDVHRMATLRETCPGQGCPPLMLASHGNDWLHGNSVQFTSDGNLLYSSRHQDWIFKIEYRNGEGSGDVIWRLGNGGDFQMNSSVPSPWFSHQHDPQVGLYDDSLVTVFDDSNLRQSVDDQAHSRGQILKLDESNMRSTLLVNTDLGGFSFAMGSSEQLPDGSYHFGGGWLPDNSSVSVDTDAGGNPIEVLRFSAPVYRSFRMRDLYTP